MTGGPSFALDFGTSRRIRWPGAVMLVLALALLGVLLWQTQALRKERSELQASRQRMERDARRAPAPPPAPSMDPRRIARIEEELHRPWLELLTALESVNRPQVRLLSIDPDARSGRVVLTAQTKSLEEAVDFVQALAGTTLQAPTLQSHQIYTELPDRPLRFVVNARWHARDDSQLALDSRK